MGTLTNRVERRNFRHRKQQLGETFDDFLVSLRELAKTCKFCSEECTQKNIRVPPNKTKYYPPRSFPPSRSNPPPTRVCLGCGGDFHPGGRRQCPAYTLTCRTCNRVGHLARVCQGGQRPAALSQPPTTPEIKATNLAPTTTLETDGEHAPTINIHVSSLNGCASLNILPDSGADISVAGPSTLTQLHEHPDNLLPSGLTPRAVNGTSMHPLGKLPVTLELEGIKYTEDFHIYSQVNGAILSWKAAKGLNILPQTYPYPATRPVINSFNLPTADPIVAEFPDVFSDQVTSMEGEEFHISLSANAKPFCVNTPCAVPFAYHDKLKAELDLLQTQGIIAAVTEPVLQLWLLRKRIHKRSDCALICPT